MPSESSRLVDIDCTPKINVIPLKQRLAIQSIKAIPTKAVTHKILRKITESCDRWNREKDATKDILQYIDDYKINWKEAKRCQDTETKQERARRFMTMNDFFQRERVGLEIQELDNSNALVSPADCRLVAYEHTHDSTKYWIKGQGFSVRKLIANNAVADRFDVGKIVICRLAPDDYHHFHFPVDALYMGSYKVDGEYYSVDPRIVRSKIDAFGDNKREVCMLYNETIGNVLCVIVAATCTGSIVLNKLQPATLYKKGTKMGTFGFGGSTVILLFERNSPLKLCQQFTENSKKAVETYVRVGTFLGKA